MYSCFARSVTVIHGLFFLYLPLCLNSVNSQSRNPYYEPFSHAVTILWKLSISVTTSEWFYLLVYFLKDFISALWRIISQVLSFSPPLLFFPLYKSNIFSLPHLSLLNNAFMYRILPVWKHNLFASFKQSCHIISLYNAIFLRHTLNDWLVCHSCILLSWDKVNERLNLGSWHAVSCGVTCYNSSKTIILMILYYTCSLWPHLNRVSIWNCTFNSFFTPQEKSSHLVTSGLGCSLLANKTALLHIWCELIKNYNGFSAGTKCANDIWG